MPLRTGFWKAKRIITKEVIRAKIIRIIRCWAREIKCVKCGSRNVSIVSWSIVDPKKIRGTRIIEGYNITAQF